MKKVRCIDSSPRNDGATLVYGRIYEVEVEGGTSYVLKGIQLSWYKTRFEDVSDADYEPVPVTLKSPTRAPNNEVDSQELMEFFFRPQPGNCICGGPKAICPYHKDNS